MITAREARDKSGVNTIMNNELAIVEMAIEEAIDEGRLSAVIAEHEFCEGMEKETLDELKRLGYTVTYDNYYQHYTVKW